MQLIADLLAGLGALGAAVYCLVLSRRLKRFNQLENGMGGAIAVLSAQVDDMTKALNRAQSTAALSAEQSWRAVRSQLTAAQVQAQRRAVQAYKALGGGWPADDFSDSTSAR